MFDERRGRLVLCHAKDISIQQSGAERGKVTGNAGRLRVRSRV